MRLHAGIALLAALAASLPAAVAAGKPPTVVVVAGKPSEYSFQVTPARVKRGPVLFHVTNLGRRAHSFEIGGRSTKSLGRHQSTTLTVVFKKPGRYIYSDKCVANPNEQEQQNVTPCAGGVLTVT